MLPSNIPIIVQRGNKPVAVIMSMAEYERAFADKEQGTETAVLTQNSFGMWANREINDEWLEDGRSRWQSNLPFCRCVQMPPA